MPGKKPKKARPGVVKDGAGVYVELDGAPVDITFGMFEEPEGEFVSKHRFAGSDMPARLRAIDWFARCGRPPRLDLSMPVRRAKSWAEAVKACTSAAWANVKTDAENQLTSFLSEHDGKNYQKWNRIVLGHTKNVVEPLLGRTVIPFAEERGLGEAFVHNVRVDVRLALMENAYLPGGHRCFFFHELLTVYEAGHLPCGWNGKWPQGKLLVF